MHIRVSRLRSGRVEQIDRLWRAEPIGLVKDVWACAGFGPTDQLTQLVKWSR
jgi:hypothetical protein